LSSPFVLTPEWEWLIVLEMFIAGLAAGTILFIVYGNLFGDPEDLEISSRLGIIPAPFMLLAAILLITDLGQPGRFPNLLVRSAAAPERGPGFFMLNPNSPMSWGTYIILIFGLLTAIAFLDALHHLPQVPFRWPDPFCGIVHNKIYLVIVGFFAAATGVYSGILLNVTNQGVWSDTILMGTLYVVLTGLEGMAVATLATERWRAWNTAFAAKTALGLFAILTAIVMVAFLVGVAATGHVGSLVASLDALVAPVFWIGVIAAIVAPLAALFGRIGVSGRVMRTGALGIVVLVGVLAIRYAVVYSSIAFVQG